VAARKRSKAYYIANRTAILAKAASYRGRRKQRSYNRTYYESHAEELKARSREYRATHLEQARATSRRYFWRHREEVLAKQRAAYAKDRETRRNTHLDFALADLDKAR
jgi:hypothetical protein